jgi:sugar fermentation stimulation protein A
MPSPLSSECGLRFGPLVGGVFLRRDNRFRAQVRLEGETDPVAAYLPNPGRLEELLVPERTVWLRPADAGRRRRTAYDLCLIEAPGEIWVSLDSRLPNSLVENVLACGGLPGFEMYSQARREVVLGESRLDFLLTGHDPHCWMEVKSVTLVEDKTAAFPDAPTKRGRRHVRELQAAVEVGERAVVVFVVQREDAREFTPHDATDPAFGTTLRAAADAGVEVRALRCRVTPESIQPLNELPIEL